MRYHTSPLGVFQSTPPVWGATRIMYGRRFLPIVSIHAPRVGSDYREVQCLHRMGVSIHAPRVGSDIEVFLPQKIGVVFQSTPPVWGATLMICKDNLMSLFQSTPPVWGATLALHLFPCVLCVSIHAPRVGSDPASPCVDGSPPCFNPRPPCGERPLLLPKVSAYLGFQSTPPVWGATAGISAVGAGALFQSTPPVWGAT